MANSFPPLLTLDVKRHLVPKLRFLKHTLGATSINTSKNESTLSSRIRTRIPPHYYGTRLEKTLAPYHAFLMYVGLPHGEELLQDDARRLKELLSACRSLKMFGALCNRWLMVEQLREQRERAGGSVDGNSGVHNLSPSTLKKENRNHGSNHNGTDTCVRFYFSKGFAFSGTKRAPFSFFSIRHSI